MIPRTARYMTANMVFRIESDRVWFATFTRYDHPLGRAVWAALSPVHRRFAPDFLAGGVRPIRRLRKGPTER